MFNFNHLYYFYITAQSGTVSAAAQQLRIRQPSLTAQIRALETTLDKKLFRRVGRTLTLTEDGKNILNYCYQIFGPALELEHYVKGDLAEKSHHFRVGLSNELDRLFSTSMLARLRSPGEKAARITMASASHDELMERLKSSVYDCVVTTQEAHDREIETLAEVRFPVVAVYQPETFGLIKLDGLRALSQLPNSWVLPSSERLLRNEIDRFFERDDMKPTISFESDMLSSVAQASALGLGLALLPRPYVLEYERFGDLRIVSNGGEGFWKSKVYFHARRAQAKLPEFLRIKALLENYETLSRSQKGSH